MSVQTKIDFTRAEQLATLRDAQLSPATIVEGATTRRVTAIVLKSVLRAIDDHGRGGEAWVSYETIAREAGCSLRQAKRAVVALVELSLLCVETRRSAYGSVVNHYRVVWNELALHRPRTQRVDVPGAASAPAGNQAGESQDTSFLPSRDARRTTDFARGPECPGDRPECPGDKEECPGDRPECPGGHTNRPETTKKRPQPPTPAPSAAGGWPELIREWRGRIASVSQLVKAATEAGDSPGALAARLSYAWDTASLPSNGFDRPAGAAVYWLRNGVWPKEGVIDADDADAVAEATRVAQQEAAKAAAASERRRAEQLRTTVDGYVRRRRREGAANEAIEAELRQRLSAAQLREVGWG